MRLDLKNKKMKINKKKKLKVKIKLFFRNFLVQKKKDADQNSIKNVKN